VAQCLAPRRDSTETEPRSSSPVHYMPWGITYCLHHHCSHLSTSMWRGPVRWIRWSLRAPTVLQVACWPSWGLPPHVRSWLPLLASGDYCIPWLISYVTLVLMSMVTLLPPLLWVKSFSASLLRTHVIAFRTHSDYPALSLTQYP
jgi:hypothetical protein